ncbi:hypothetical protein AAHE18_05G252400 [Arachis hypogaea]
MQHQLILLHLLYIYIAESSLSIPLETTQREEKGRKSGDCSRKRRRKTSTGSSSSAYITIKKKEKGHQGSCYPKPKKEPYPFSFMISLVFFLLSKTQ